MATASALLMDEYYEAADDRFLAEVLASTAAKRLKAIGDRWYDDKRAFARGALLAYIDEGCDRPHHRALVKTLFKRAEKAKDDEAMGRFMVAFDRLMHRRLKDAWVWDPASRRAQRAKVLKADPNVPAKLGSKENRAPRFSKRTRMYLARRTFRYMRDLAHRDEARYGRVIRAALARYEDASLASAPQFLDSWGLVHALYWGCPVLVRDPRGVVVADGRSLSEVTPAPFAPGAWRGVFDAMIDLVAQARSRTVRVFAIGMIERDYDREGRAVPLGRVRALLRSPHEEVQTFAAKLLQNATGVHNLSIEEWLELLRIDNPQAIPLLCELVAKTVSPDRMTLAQCIELACAKPAPVAELGLAWAKKKPVNDEAALVIALGIARAGAPAVREAGLAWVTSILEKASFAKPEHVRDLLDARFEDARARGLLLLEDARFRESTTLWGALAESPYDDVRVVLVKHLREREASFGPETLRHVWITSLLAVHRGGRAKRAALLQIAARIAHKPVEAESLLPLFGIALRSVRAPERRAAIAAVASAAVRDPSIERAIARALPDLKIERGAAV